MVKKNRPHVGAKEYKVGDHVRVHYTKSKYWGRLGTVQKVNKAKLTVDFDNPEGQYEYGYVYKEHVYIEKQAESETESETEEESEDSEVEEEGTRMVKRDSKPGISGVAFGGIPEKNGKGSRRTNR